jgi:hypothetical protein
MACLFRMRNLLPARFRHQIPAQLRDKDLGWADRGKHRHNGALNDALFRWWDSIL